MKKELLVPVKSMEHLYAAIWNGCDAVYLGGKRFGARAYADNFTMEELEQAILICHLYDVKCYVTVNVMVFEREREEVYHYLKFLHSHNVDAVIVSDMGIISWIHNHLPELKVHVSTQAHTFQKSQIEFLKTLGVERVVIDRETSLEEIQKFPDDMEYEVFVHGALCASYSGCCLFSALNEGRSGNRGTCAQYCRMKYKLYQNGKLVPTQGEYLLSTKDLYTLPHRKELLSSKITSFKIEGRMKSREYVALLTRMYRFYLDHLETEIKKEDEEKIQKTFYREFTDGYLFQSNSIYNEKTPNHQGIKIGSIQEASPQKLKIDLEANLHQGDGIRFGSTEYGQIVNFLYDKNGRYIKEAKKGSIVWIDNKFAIKDKLTVRKTFDILLQEELQNTKERIIPITIKGIFAQNKCTLILKDKNHVVEVTDHFGEYAKNRSTSKEEIKQKLEKVGNTPFTVERIEIELEDNLFIPMSSLNELRRKGMDLLKKERMERRL